MPSVRFLNEVFRRREPPGVPGFALVGRAHAAPNETVMVTFTVPPPPGMPDTFQDGAVEETGSGQYAITSGDRRWTLSGIAHVHRDVTARFYKALPPRPVPLRKRVFWQVVLALAGNRLARRLLLRG